MGASERAPQAVPPDTVATAAGLWVTLGNLNGFTVGVEWAALMVEAALAKGASRWMPARLRARLEQEQRETVNQLRQHVAAKRAETQALEPAARVVTARLEERRIELETARVRGGLSYFKAGVLAGGTFCFGFLSALAVALLAAR